MRPFAMLLAFLALAGTAVAAEGGAAKSPAAGSYIVVEAVQDPDLMISFMSGAPPPPPPPPPARPPPYKGTGRP